MTEQSANLLKHQTVLYYTLIEQRIHIAINSFQDLEIYISGSF